MTEVALIEYLVTDDETIIFIGRREFDAPLVFRANLNGAPLTRSAISLRLQRLAIDFNGVASVADGDADEVRDALRLAPSVHLRMRRQPIQQINLPIPVFNYDLDYLYELSDALIPKEARPYLESCNVLCIVPHGPLHGLPFAALHWDDKTYLIDRFGLCQLPSASVLPYCRQRNPRRSELHQSKRSALIVALASVDDDDPGTFEEEGERIRSILASAAAPVTVMAGPTGGAGTKPASKQGILEEINKYDLIHIASHGLFGLSGLHNALDAAGFLVSDGISRPPLAGLAELEGEVRASFFLSARELLGLSLRAELITLRSCWSGRVQVRRSGDEMTGLIRSLLYAGASSMLAGLWAVNKESSRLLVETFYKIWEAGTSDVQKWEALQKAAQTVRSCPEYSHPYHWAPFVLIGDWL